MTGSATPLRPLYVDRRSEQELAPPLAYQDTRLYGFLIPADQGRLHDLCNKFINTPSGNQLDYRPAGPLVLLFFSLVRSWSATGSPSAGTIELREAGFWIPVTKTPTGAPEGELHIGLYPFYVFSDNGLVRATGREVYGAPIDSCALQMPKEVGGVGGFHLSVNVVSVFEPTTRAQMELLLRVVPVVPLTPPHAALGIASLAATPAPWTTVRAAAEGVPAMAAAAVAPPTNLEEVEERSTLAEVDVVSLKQFRAAHRADLACYQSVVEAKLQLDAFGGGGPMPGKYQLMVRRVDSHPIVAEMGLQTDAFSTLTGFWLDLNYTVGLGKETRVP